MDEENVSKLFEPFYRGTDSRYEQVSGAGLGLTIVKSLVTLLNGHIEVTSKKDEGSCFTVTLYLKALELLEIAGAIVTGTKNESRAKYTDSGSYCKQRGRGYSAKPKSRF